MLALIRGGSSGGGKSSDTGFILIELTGFPDSLQVACKKISTSPKFWHEELERCNFHTPREVRMWVKQSWWKRTVYMSIRHPSDTECMGLEFKRELFKHQTWGFPGLSTKIILFFVWNFHSSSFLIKITQLTISKVVFWLRTILKEMFQW